MSNLNLTICPSCGGKRIKKVRKSAVKTQRQALPLRRLTLGAPHQQKCYSRIGIEYRATTTVMLSRPPLLSARSTKL